LVSDSVTVISPRKGVSDLVRMDVPQVVARMGVLPEQIPDFKAISGDPSDNIPGARGVGPKTAASLLLRYGTLENLLENYAPLQAEAERLLMFREVVRMKADVPVELPPSGPPNWSAAA